jgi:hypothetical protein
LPRLSSRTNQVIPKNFNDFIYHPDILIKPSDKNLGLTILDKKWYVDEGLNQLSDQSFYRGPLTEDIVKFPTIFIDRISRQANKLISRLNNSPLTTPQHIKYLKHCILTKRTIPTFHLLPKIHKTPIKGRPIVPSHSWLTTGFSVWIDSILQKILPELDIIIKDTKSLIIQLEKVILPPGEIWLVTGDVSSMYTNIPTNTTTYQSLSNFISSKLSLTPCEKTLLEQTFRFIMANNYFEFNGSYYKQVNGIAMGTACAPAFANLFMYLAERKFFDDNASQTLPIYYGRYIDDIFMIFKGTHSELQSFLNKFDSTRPYHNELKITWQFSPMSIEFLDLVVHVQRDKNRIEFSTHQKPLNKYLYVPFCSYHPRDSKTGFIKAELIRYVRNSSTYHSFATIAKKFFTRLRARGYPPRYLIWVFSKVFYNKRSEYLQGSKHNYDSSMIPFVTTYNPLWELPHLKNGLRKFTSLNPHYRPVIAFKRNKNIADFINKANKFKLRKKVLSRPGTELSSDRFKKTKP